MLHRTVQSALLGAVHGLEQQCADLFADWNHQALLQHARHVADTLSAAEPSTVSSDAAPSHAELLQMHSPHATPVSAPPEASTSPGTVHSSVCDGTPKQEGTEERRQDAHTREGSPAPQLPSTGSKAAPACSNALQPDSDAVHRPTSASTADSRAGSVTAVEGAGLLTETPLQPSAPHAQQPRSRPADRAASTSERLQAVLKGPVSSAKALAVLAAVHTGAASLGLAAGLGRMPWPLYLIGTRDSFTHHLHAEQSRVSLGTVVTPSAVATEVHRRSPHVLHHASTALQAGGLVGRSLPCKIACCNTFARCLLAVMQVQLGDRSCLKTDFFFKACSVPSNYSEVCSPCPYFRVCASRKLPCSSHSYQVLCL